MFRRSDPRRQQINRGVLINLLYVAGMGEALNPDDPFAAERGVLVAVLEQTKRLPSETDLNNAVRYLEEREYVQVRWSKDHSGAFEYVRLISKGIDLAEGTVRDAGVIVPELRL